MCGLFSGVNLTLNLKKETIAKVVGVVNQVSYERDRSLEDHFAVQITYKLVNY